MQLRGSQVGGEGGGSVTRAARKGRGVREYGENHTHPTAAAADVDNKDRRVTWTEQTRTRTERGLNPSPPRRPCRVPTSVLATTRRAPPRVDPRGHRESNTRQQGTRGRGSEPGVTTQRERKRKGRRRRCSESPENTLARRWTRGHERSKTQQ